MSMVNMRDALRTQPLPRPGTRVRIIGPTVMNGMKIWRVYDVNTEQQIGPTCFSSEEAGKRADEYLSGKKVIWMGHTKFERKKIS